VSYLSSGNFQNPARSGHASSDIYRIFQWRRPTTRNRHRAAIRPDFVEELSEPTSAPARLENSREENLGIVRLPSENLSLTISHPSVLGARQSSNCDARVHACDEVLQSLDFLKKEATLTNGNAFSSQKCEESEQAA
jgi:hypothetical protein